MTHGKPYLLENAPAIDRSTTRAEEIREHLASDIVHGRLAPGVALDETEVAHRFGVSRTPVREAIRQLEATGLVEARPRRGSVVSAVSKDRLDEMFFMMLELEALCAREAALAMTRAERDALLALQSSGADIARCGDADRYFRHNLAFHDAIYAGTRNSYLTELTTMVRKRLAPFRRAQFAGAGRLPGSQREHGLITKAIVAGNGEDAAEKMRAHIRAVRDSYVALVPGYGTMDR